MNLSTFKISSKYGIIAFNLVFLFILMLVAERILEVVREYQTDIISTYERQIPLNEHVPNSILYFSPDADMLEDSPTLEEKQYRLKIDSEGYIEPSRIHEAPDLTVVFLGDDVTENIYVEETSRFHYSFGRILKRDSLLVNSYNAGHYANTVRHSINILLNKAILLRPDYVVLMHNLSDLRELIETTSQHADYLDTKPLIENVKLDPIAHISSTSNTIFYDLFPNLFKKIHGGARSIKLQLSEDPLINNWDTINNNHLIHQFKIRLRTFVEICKTQSIQPILMTQPSLLTDLASESVQIRVTRDFRIVPSDYKKLNDMYDTLNQAIRDVAVQSGTKVIDLAARIPKSNKYLYDYAHLNKEGSQMTAEILARAFTSPI